LGSFIPVIQATIGGTRIVGRTTAGMFLFIFKEIKKVYLFPITLLIMN